MHTDVLRDDHPLDLRKPYNLVCSSPGIELTDDNPIAGSMPTLQRAWTIECRVLLGQVGLRKM